MEVINDNNEGRLTNRDLALAAYSLAEMHNLYLRALENGEYGEDMTKEQMEETIERIRLAHTKFDALLKLTTEAAEQDAEKE
jgi:phage terminase Nu1 subunit (DNA packaging protein)